MNELLQINVNEHTEKKNGLTYLSWAWAWAKVLMVDPQARWAVSEFGPEQAKLPCCFLPDGSAMVRVAVTIKGDQKSAVLPVMDHRNKAIKNPDAFAINTAIQRCLVKAIAMHGLGLYIYAGEDLPEGEEEAPPPKKTGAMADVMAALPPLAPEDKLYFDELASDVRDIFAKQGAKTAYDRVEIEQLDNEQKLHLWDRLDSKIRSALKAEKGMRTAAA